MIPIPETRDVDLAFGNIDYLPDYDKIPEIFKNGNHKWNKFVSSWFFKGLTENEINLLVSKENVDKQKALRAISAILKSWGPKHEHKEAGTAYLMSEWFEELK